MRQLYKREGRRFIKTDSSQIIVNNVGKYYQPDGTFTAERTEHSIGICILSYATEHVVMFLEDVIFSEKDERVYTYQQALEKIKTLPIQNIELPQVAEMLTALMYFKDLLTLHDRINYRCLKGSASYATHAGYGGYSAFSAPSDAPYVAEFRPVIRVKQN